MKAHWLCSYGMKGNTINRGVILYLLPAKYTIRHSIEYLVVILCREHVQGKESRRVRGYSWGNCITASFQIMRLRSVRSYKTRINTRLKNLGLINK